MSLPEPITRKEQYYDGIAKGNASKLPEPITREEQYLEYIAKNGGGGGGGTTDYEALDNKPSVNSVELSGNKTLDDLGIQGKLTFDNEPTEDSQNPVKSGGVYESLESINEAISSKPDEYADLDDKPSINDVTLDGNKTPLDLGLQPTLDGAQTVSGNPITVTDAEAMNAESVKVELEPKQDLHGYDKPWAGGAGKNKLPYFTAEEKNDIRLTYDDGVVVLNGTASANAFFILSNLNLTSNNYVFSANNDTANSGVHISLREIGASSDFADLPINDIDKHNFYQNVSIGQVTLYVFSGTQLTDFRLPLQIEVGSTATDFEPYSNICPISGYSEVNVERCGKNLFDKNQTFAYNGFISSDGTLTASEFWWTTDYQLIKSGTYTLSGVLSEVSAYYGICWFDKNKNYISGFQAFTLENVSVNIPTTAKYIRYSVNQEALNTFQLELGNQATTYEPYQGTTYTVSLGGTKYGGVLDVTSGVLTVTHGEIASYAGETLPSEWISDRDEYEAGTTPTTGAQVVYELATPTSVSTTPTDITLLENTNNISSDGTNIQLRYQPNNVIGECKAYTDEQCAKVLPPLPTTDGTYHLSCEVTSGVGVLSWVSDS